MHRLAHVRRVVDAVTLLVLLLLLLVLVVLVFVVVVVVVVVAILLFHTIRALLPTLSSERVSTARARRTARPQNAHMANPY